MRGPGRFVPAALLAFGLASPAAAEPSVEIPTREEMEDALPEGGALTGKEIYERVRDTKLSSGVQHMEVISKDPGGNEQRHRFWVRWKDWRDEDSKPVDGIVAKTLVRLREPPDMRDTGFLMIANVDRDPDQFVYLPSERKIRRMRLEGVGVMGTDFKFEDIAVGNLGNAEYLRLEDEEVDGEPCYVVESTLKPTVDSDYRTTRAWIQKEHYIPLRILYMDEAGVTIREFTADPASIREFDGTWIATHSEMKDLREETSTVLIVEKLDPDPNLGDNLFTLVRLQFGR